MVRSERPRTGRDSPSQGPGSEGIVENARGSRALGGVERERHSLLQLSAAAFATMPSALALVDTNLQVLRANQRFRERCARLAPEASGSSTPAALVAYLDCGSALLARMHVVLADPGQDELLAAGARAPVARTRASTPSCGVSCAE